ncbi:unnamed protein product, partial [marine sediment metagenome]
MSEYNKERVARLFDGKTTTRTETADKTITSSQSVPQMAGEIAFERLKLKTQDVLLDVGTGTGDKAIRAAHICRQVVGIDISRKSLEIARRKSSKDGLNNTIFAYGSFEDPCAELNLSSHGITKILAVYSLHHLPDLLKKKSLRTLANLLRRPGLMVIADLMFFDDPNKYRRQFDEVGYDGGDTDFPSRIEYLRGCLSDLRAKVHITQIHPLVGVL